VARRREACINGADPPTPLAAGEAGSAGSDPAWAKLAYPANLTISNLAYFLAAPTLCYQVWGRSPPGPPWTVLCAKGFRLSQAEAVCTTTAHLTCSEHRSASPVSGLLCAAAHAPQPNYPRSGSIRWKWLVSAAGGSRVQGVQGGTAGWLVGAAEHRSPIYACSHTTGDGTQAMQGCTLWPHAACRRGAGWS
jgi:hypothetical protein